MRRGLFPAAVFAAAAVSLSAAASVAAPAPRVSIASLRELPTPLPYPYDPSADAHREVAAAQARAKAQGKLLLIDLGGDWCADCRILAAVMRLPEVAAFVDAHYVLVSVDIGRLDRNLDIPRAFGAGHVEAVPALLVVDRHGRLLDQDHLQALSDARYMTPQALADWLAKWTD